MTDPIMNEIGSHIGEILIGIGIGLFAIWRLVAPAMGRYFATKLDAKTQEIRAELETKQQELEIKREDDRLKHEQELAEIKSRTENFDKLITTQERLVNSIVDISNSFSRESHAHAAALNSNTESISGLTEVIDNKFTTLSEDNAQLNTRLKALEDGVSKINTTIQGLPNCEGYTAEINAMEARLMAAIKEQAKRETTQTSVVTEPANVMHDDGGTKPASEAAA